MSVFRKNPILLLCLAGTVVLWGRPSFSETAIAEKMLSSDMVVKAAYQPGSGLPVGKIKAVRGEVIIFHRDPSEGYPVRTGLPLYQGDIIRGILPSGSEFRVVQVKEEGNWETGSYIRPYVEITQCSDPQWIGAIVYPSGMTTYDNEHPVPKFKPEYVEEIP